MKKALLLISLNLVAVAKNNVYLYNCPVEYSLMYAIAMNERHPKKEIGYPFIISFNGKLPATLEKVLIEYGLIKLDDRSFDCKNLRKCIVATTYLIDKGFKNLDLGAYQINYKYHKFELLSYFSLKESYKKACSILVDNIAKYGYSLKAIAGYHSFTKKHNLKYAKKILKGLRHE